LPPHGARVDSPVTFGSIRRGRCGPTLCTTQHELVMLVDGEVEFEAAGVIHRPRIGEKLLIPAGDQHTVHNRGTTESHWLYGYRREESSGRYTGTTT